MMKIISLRLALQTAVLASFVIATAHAEETKKATFSEQALQAKIQYCTYCHQPSGQGYPPASIPRLAGQQTEYLVNQLQAFIDRRRVNMFMFKVAHSLKPDMLPPLAEHFSELNPKPAEAGPSKLADEGKRIFEGGVPEGNIPACAVCHGLEARGKGPVPRLAGQIYPYIIKVLQNWGKERGQDPAHPDTSAIMEPVAHGLNESQIKAVAAYVSSLE